jgi:alpha-galactosidase
MVYGLWFEPERVVEGTDIARNRGDWVLRGKSGGGGGLLNFGLPEVQKYFFGIVDEYLRLPGFEVYRQDCNIDPLSFWRENDAPNRQGITEMHYIAGLYAYWDMIKARYPNALMEECASGGRRIDLETIVRFHIHQKSDYWFDNVIDQASIYGLSQYLPNGLVSVPLNRLDDYSFHSTLASSLILGWIADGEGFDMSRAKTITDTYREVRHLLNGDWYGLTDYSPDESKWLASQYHRADLDEGMVLAFRRKECRQDTLRVQLKGLNPATTYEVRFTTTGRREEFTGEQLAKALELTISRTPRSDLIIYRKTKPNARE